MRRSNQSGQDFTRCLPSNLTDHYKVKFLRYSPNSVIFKVFTHGDAVVVGISNNLILDLLPAFEWFVHQDLWCVCECWCHQRNKLLAVVGEAWTQSSKSECWTDQNRVAQTFCGRDSLQQRSGQIETQSSRRTLMKERAKVINQLVSPYLLHRQCCFTGSHMFVDLFHFLHKDFPVFGHLNGGHWRPQNRDFILLQDPLLGELHPAVQSRLTTEGQQHTVRSLILYHLRGEQGRAGVISENGIESKLRWVSITQSSLLYTEICSFSASFTAFCVFCMLYRQDIRRRHRCLCCISAAFSR